MDFSSALRGIARRRMRSAGQPGLRPTRRDGRSAPRAGQLLVEQDLEGRERAPELAGLEEELRAFGFPEPLLPDAERLAQDHAAGATAAASLGRSGRCRNRKQVTT